MSFIQRILKKEISFGFLDFQNLYFFDNRNEHEVQESKVKSTLKKSTASVDTRDSKFSKL